MTATGAPLPDLDRLHTALLEIAVKAGRVALRDFRAGRRTTAEVQWKAGNSPVTSADHAVDAFLAETLPGAAGLSLHSEERPASWRDDAGAATFVIDPIDGTRNFIEGGDAWCIVIGVIAAGRPVAGVVHVPARGETFSAFSGGGAFLNGARLTLPEAVPRPSPPRVAGPKPFVEDLGRRLGVAFVHAPPVPALAHRVLLPLTGRVDLALARAGGHDWDIVASDCILREAGAQLLTVHGHTPDYRLSGESHPPLLAGSPALLQKIGAALLTDPA